MRKTRFSPTPIVIKHKQDTQLVTGFTLIEILVSLFILLVGIIVLLNLFPLGMQSLACSRKLGEVSLLAQKKMEELKTQGLPGASGNSGSEGDLNWLLTAKPLKLAEGIEVINVELDIEYNYQGKPQKQEFITYLVDN